VDGRLGEHTALVKDQGATGPNNERQEAPHPHWIETSPDNRFALVADLGLDEVLVYKFDAASGTLTPNEPAFARLKAGSGPRHAVVYPNGRFVFAVSELSSTATSFAYDAKKGTLKEIRTASTLPPDSPAGTTWPKPPCTQTESFSTSPTGETTALRFFPSIRETELYRRPGDSDGWQGAAALAIDPSGKYLLAENQFSNTLSFSRLIPRRAA